LAGGAGLHSGGHEIGENESRPILCDWFSLIACPPDAALRAARRIADLCVTASLWFSFDDDGS
jgi:hypothetical protein